MVRIAVKYQDDDGETRNYHFDEGGFCIMFVFKQVHVWCKTKQPDKTFEFKPTSKTFDFDSIVEFVVE